MSHIANFLDPLFNSITPEKNHIHSDLRTHAAERPLRGAYCLTPFTRRRYVICTEMSILALATEVSRQQDLATYVRTLSFRNFLDTWVPRTFLQASAGNSPFRGPPNL